MTEQTQETTAVAEVAKTEPKAKRQSGVTVTLVRELHVDEKMPAQGKIVYDTILAKYGINAPFSRDELIDLLEPRAEEFKTRQTVERIVVFYLNDFKAKRNLVTLTKAEAAAKPAKEPKVVVAKTAPEVAAQAAPENKGGTKAAKTAVKDAAA